MKDNLIEYENKTFQEAMADHSAGGSSVAAMRFFLRENIPHDPTDKEPEPLARFGEILCMEAEDKSKYPFEESFYEEFKKECQEVYSLCEMLWNTDAKADACKMARIAGALATINFLQHNRKKVVEVMNEIRGV